MTPTAKFHREGNLNPTGIDPEEELPLRFAPAEPLWAENFCYSAWDHQSPFGLWLHLGRTPYNARLWREMVCVFLPDGNFFVAKAFAKGAHDRGPGAAGARLTCIKPFESWQLEFDGAGRYVTPDELQAGPLMDGFFEPFNLSLRFDAAAPMWDMGRAMHGQHWGRSHHEQTCRVAGEFRLRDGTVLNLNGGGIRDHTRGARDFATLHSHVWLNAVFPSGRSFCVLDVTTRDAKTRLSRAFTADSDTLVEAEMIGTPFLRDPDSPAKNYEFALRQENKTTTITAEVLQVLPMAMMRPNELILGMDRRQNARNRLYEGVTRFTWDGEVTYGLTERTCPLIQ